MRRVINSIVDLDRLSSSLPGLAAWYRDRRAYMELPGAERLDWRASDPQVHDLTPRSPFDPHYFYQDVWAAQRVAELGPKRHVDVGSRVDLVGFLTAITEVTFVDIRLLEAEVEGLSSVEGSVLEMPFPGRSLESVSCLHVAEHIGLGRYGDPLDPDGTVKAMKELQRVVAPGGQLLFAGPVGRRQVVFNAHRIQPPSSVIEIFDELELIEGLRAELEESSSRLTELEEEQERAAPELTRTASANVWQVRCASPHHTVWADGMS